MRLLNHNFPNVEGKKKGGEAGGMQTPQKQL